MVVLITGSSGFLGRRIADALAAAGHRVVRGVRPGRPPAPDTIAVDFARDHDPVLWQRRLHGIDAVVNAVGILRERGDQTFAALHERAPKALFAACAAHGVRRVVQLSALGASAGAASHYQRSKALADDFALQRLPGAAVVVRPSLVFGAGGASARLFVRLAALPLLPLPGGGASPVQPIHVDDAVQAIVALVERDDAPVGRAVALVGPRPLALREFIAELRAALGRPPARVVALPWPLADAAAALAGHWPGSLLDRETLAMLRLGSVAAADDTRALLGRAPREPAHFVAGGEASALLLQARLAWLDPLLRASVAAVWLWTGIVSLGLYPVPASLALLDRAGAPAALAPLLLYGAAALDLALGALTVLHPRRWLWWAQLALMGLYTAVITLRLPEYWLHPYGPMVKNLPLAALLVLLLALGDEERRR